jgi:hypothetical protein
MLKPALCGMCLIEISPETTVCRRVQTVVDRLRNAKQDTLCLILRSGVFNANEEELRKVNKLKNQQLFVSFGAECSCWIGAAKWVHAREALVGNWWMAMHSCSSLVLNLAHSPALSGHVVHEELGSDGDGQVAILLLTFYRLRRCISQ